MRLQRNKPLLAILAVLLFTAVLAGVYFGVQLLEKDEHPETRGSMTEGFGELKTVEYNGVTYREKPAVTTMLLMGIDKEETAEAPRVTSYRNGGQADFLLLLAIDHTDKRIHQLQIDRDTMTEVSVLGVFGNETGTRVLQICLAHSFGATPEDNAKYTVKAVQNLLGGLELDGYYVIDYNAVPVFNDALGGVNVEIPYDMTSVNPAWTAGTKVTLHGKDAEHFVRSRKTVDDGSNASRMTRQNQYMTNALALMKKRISDDLSFGENLLNTLNGIAVTDFTNTRLVNEVNECYAYTVEPVDYLDGTYCLGQDSFIEFHANENSPVEWVLNHLYTKK